MLISYRFKNFCSFAEEAEFDMMAPGNKVKHRFPDNYVKTEEGYDILKTAGSDWGKCRRKDKLY